MSRKVKHVSSVSVGVLENIYFLNELLNKHVRISFVADCDFSLRIQFFDRHSTLCLDFNEYCSLCVHRTSIWESLHKSTYFCTDLNCRLQISVKSQCVVLKDKDTGIKILFRFEDWETVEKLFPCLNLTTYQNYDREANVRSYIKTLLREKDFIAPKHSDCLSIEEGKRIFNELYFINLKNLYLLNFDVSTNCAITYGPSMECAPDHGDN